MPKSKRGLEVTSKLHATRQRRYRSRQANGKLVVEVELNTTETAKLHRLHCVDLDKVEDRAALAHGIHLLIATIRED